MLITHFYMNMDISFTCQEHTLIETFHRERRFGQ